MNKHPKLNNNTPYEIRIPIERVKKLIESLNEGMPLKYACDYAMIIPQVIQKWNKSFEDFISRWEQDEKSVDITLIEPPYDKNGNLVYSKLTTLSAVVVIKNARSGYMKNLNALLKESRKESDQWQKYAWLLERCFRDAYAKDEPIQEESKKIDGVKVTFVDPKTDAERLAKLDKEVKENINVHD